MINFKYQLQKQRFLEDVAFKNVSGKWQFKGDVTPEFVLERALIYFPNKLKPTQDGIQTHKKPTTVL